MFIYLSPAKVYETRDLIMSTIFQTTHKRVRVDKREKNHLKFFFFFYSLKPQIKNSILLNE